MATQQGEEDIFFLKQQGTITCYGSYIIVLVILVKLQFLR